MEKKRERERERRKEKTKTAEQSLTVSLQIEEFEGQKGILIYKKKALRCLIIGAFYIKKKSSRTNRKAKWYLTIKENGYCSCDIRSFYRATRYKILCKDSSTFRS
jgi:hypothetical protein